MTKELFDHDKNYLPLVVAGCDEAGRGPLAGPVVVAACIMPMDFMIEGINDSKKLSDKERRRLYPIIKQSAISYQIAVIEREVIDEINIYQAAKRGFCQTINSLKTPPDLVFTDAMPGLDIIYPYESIIKGDSISYNIASASILAKVYRDDIMIEYDKIYPVYGFASHKGYPTKEHIIALKKHGPCTLHRKLFIRNCFSENNINA